MRTWRTAVGITGGMAVAIAFFQHDARSQKPDPSPDQYEVLIHHLLRRATNLSHEIQEQQNNCLREENDMLRGKKVSHKLDLGPDTDRLIEGALDEQDYIEEHNRRHPEKPWAGVNDILKHLCGDCRSYRANHEADMKAP